MHGTKGSHILSAHAHGVSHASGGLVAEVVPTPRIVFWETTGACNLRCVHCRRSWLDAGPSELTTDQVKHRLIDGVVQAGWNSIIVFSGGEPLMRSDLFDLLGYAQSQGVLCAVATNATLVTCSIAEEFRRLGVSRVSVSLDGADAHTHDSFRGVDGSFDQALTGIRRLRDAGVEVQVNVTFTKKNQREASAMLDLVTTIGACALHVFLLVPVGCGVRIPHDVRLDSHEVEKLLHFFDREATTRNMEIRATCAPQAQRVRLQRARLLRNQPQGPGRGLAPSGKGCLAGGGVLFVDAVGKVFPCGYLPIEVGDIVTTSLQEILARSEFLAQLRDVSKLQGRCSGCDWAPRCGGCRARAYGTTGNVFAEEPSCPMHQANACCDRGAMDLSHATHGSHDARITRKRD